MSEPDAARRWGARIAIGAGLALLVTAPAPSAELLARDLALAGLATGLGLLAITAGVAALSRDPLPDALRSGPSTPPLGAGEAVVLALGLLGLSAALDLAIDVTGVREGSRLVDFDRALAAAGPSDLLLALIGLALAPAIAEEALFRGLLLRAIERRAGAAAAIGLSAIVFGFAHLELAQGAAAAVLGIHLGVLVVATGSIRAGVLCHLVNNTIAVLSPSLGDPLAAGGPIGPLFGTALAGCAIASVWLIARRLRGRAAAAA